MRRLIVLAAAGALVLAPIAAEAKPAAKPAYQVSAAVNAVNSEVGKAVQVTGKVTGKSAAGKFVSVQRKSGSGAWTTVARAKVTKKRTYAGKVPMTNGGKTSIRVIMPATKAARSGVSSTRVVKVYRWLSMTKQPSLVGGLANNGTTGTIKGTKYPGSIALITGLVTVKTNKLCTRFTTTLGFDDASTLTPDSEFSVHLFDPTDEASPEPRTLRPGDRIGVQTNITSASYYTVAGTGNTGLDIHPIIGSPRLYCTADALPSFGPGELDPLGPMQP